MNVGFIIDIDGIISEDDLKIPYLSGLHYRHFSKGDFNINDVITFRAEILERNYEGQDIDKYIYYIVVTNKEDSINQISKCLDDIQKSRIDFRQDKDEVHICLNIKDSDGMSLSKYESMMPCLKNNAICIYNWLLDRYDYDGGLLISNSRRAHAIVRLAYLICMHRRELSLVQMNTADGAPIYNLFGDTSVFFNEEERDRSVRNYYYFKNLQHMLNYSDKDIDDYLNENVIPYKEVKDEMEKRIDSTSSSFIDNHRIPIEATIITEKTQGLLLKSSDDDTDYLINAKDNSLVFISDLSFKQEWQMKETDNMVDGYCKRISNGNEFQSTISDEFISNIQEQVIIHKRTVFDKINNQVSKSRRSQVDAFKGKIDDCLHYFFNRNESQYSTLSEVLTSTDVLAHRSNIDYGLAFLEYLESGNDGNLSDNIVSAGDVNLSMIREKTRIEEAKRLLELEEKEKEIKSNYSPGADGKPSTVKVKFDTLDKSIDRCNEGIRAQTFQLDNWYDQDAETKLTARSRSVISIIAGILSSSIWAVVYFKWLRQIASFDKYAWIIYSVLFITGVLIGALILWDVVRQRKELEKQLIGFKDGKKRLVRDCMDDMKDLVEKRYRHMLVYHGLKTLTELVEFVRRKIGDLTSFHKMLFRLLINYKLSSIQATEKFASDSNTIELNDIDVTTLLFGREGEKLSIAYCLNSSSLSEAFNDYRRRKVQFETLRFFSDYKPKEIFDPESIENEVIPCKDEHIDKGYEYSSLKQMSILPTHNDVGMDDVNQGKVGDCYFMATLASIAHMNPDYIIGKRGIIEQLGEENRFFRVKFFDKDGNRVNVDIDNQFWNQSGCPIYAGVGKTKDESNESYNPWVMAVEKAWAKLNEGGYDAIEGADGDGIERVRMVEYSYAVTGKTAFYCMTKNVPDRQKLLEMIQKHFLTEKLPITLYSANSGDSSFPNKDPYLVESHAYALRAVHEDGTLDIFNPWNEHMADEDIRGKHYEKVDIDFIKDNFDVVVFFDIKEGDFSSFERNLTGNASEIQLAQKIETIMNSGLQRIGSDFNQLNDLMDEEVLSKLYRYSVYLFNKARIRDSRGVDLTEQNIIYMEPVRVNDDANKKLRNFLTERGESNIISLGKRCDDKQSITIWRISPSFILKNFD